MKFKVGGAVHASTYIGEFQANTPEEAMQMAHEVAGISVCHQCAGSIEDPELAHLWAEDETGDVTAEPSDRDKLVALQTQLDAARNVIEAADGMRKNLNLGALSWGLRFDDARAEFAKVDGDER